MSPELDKIREILTDLENVNQNLLELADDLWLEIDNRDPVAVQDGAAFMVDYLKKSAVLANASTQLAELIQRNTKVDIGAIPVGYSGDAGSENAKRIIAELNRETPHNIDENFRYKRPYGFVLEGAAVKDTVNWRQVFGMVCKNLFRKNPVLFANLITNPDYMTTQGNQLFSKDPNTLRYGLKITNGVYAEANLSANGLCKNIRRLLDTFGIPETDLKIYLRQDRDANQVT